MTTAEHADRASLDREWWRLTAAFLARPRPLFVALRDDSDEAASARQEPVTALVMLGGVAAVLASGAAARLLDDHIYDGLLIAVWAFIAGGIYGVASYWLAGACLLAGERGAGGQGSYRQARHLLAFATAPLVVWLVFVWPVRLALYGEDLFRTGGSDTHGGRYVFDALGAVFVFWCLALLAYGMRTVHGWDWRRSAIAVSLAIAALCAFAIVAAVLG